MKRKWITGLAFVTVILAGIFWIVRPHSKVDSTTSSSISETTVTDSNKNTVLQRPVSLGSDASPTPPVNDKVIPENNTEDQSRWSEPVNDVTLNDIAKELRNLQSQPDTDAVRSQIITLIRQWAEQDVRTAAKWVENMPSGDLKTEAINMIAIAFANQDLMDAIRWTWQLPDGADRNSAIQHVGYEAAITEPVTALTLAVGSLPPIKERDDLINYASLQWASRDPEAASAWADQIQDASLRERALVNITTAWGETDPVKAAEFALLKIAPGRAQDDALIAIIQRWVQTDPEAAADWVETFPEGPLFEAAAENIRQLWPVKTK